MGGLSIERMRGREEERMGYVLKGRTYCDKDYTRIVEDDEAPPKTGRILLGNEGDEIPDQVAVAVGLKRGKRAPAEDKDESANGAAESKDDSKTAPEITHLGGGVYEIPSGKRIKGRDEAQEAANAEAAEATEKSAGD